MQVDGLSIRQILPEMLASAADSSATVFPSAAAASAPLGGTEGAVVRLTFHLPRQQTAPPDGAFTRCLIPKFREGLRFR